MEYTRKYLDTGRLRVAYHAAGTPGTKKLLLLHGNLSSSVFFLPLFPLLEKEYEIAAPDLRGFGDTEVLPIDATRGYRDWSDDAASFVKALGWRSFSVLGWSMGGNVAMQMAADHGGPIRKLALLAPGSPYGFGGTRGAEGTLLQPPGLGSGGGCANPTLVAMAAAGSRLFLRDVLRKYYFGAPFRLNWSWENRFIEEIAKTRVGVDAYPGDYVYAEKWPHVLPGTRGVLNAMSPVYGDQRAFLALERKPPVLWIRGEDDIIVSDRSLMEFGYLGQTGIVGGWPGEEEYPPQPMVTQTAGFFDRYAEAGGSVERKVMPGGHMCALEHPETFVTILKEFL
ncbi:MAG: alpha/beta hydrolase [Oscillospiraceae bacterium]|nr:alpha/beta hydrolase [Oscillospiraceae bacterium]